VVVSAGQVVLLLVLCVAALFLISGGSNRG
jgi:hypothetical protein